MRNKELFRGRRKAGRIVGLVLTLALAVSLLSGCGQSKEMCIRDRVEAGDYIRFVPIDEDEYKRIRELVERGEYQCTVHEEA